MSFPPQLLPIPGAAPVTQSTTGPANIRPTQPVFFQASDVQTTSDAEGNVAVVLAGNFVATQTRPNGDIVELQADRAVLFTPLKSIREIGQGKRFKRIEDAVIAAYLESDVRITFTPAAAFSLPQRRASSGCGRERVYYEFTTDRAVLTDAVIHTIEPNLNVPVIIRASTVRQLSIGEYRSEHVQLSTSSFATPSYSVAAERAYVHTYDTNDPRLGQRTDFVAHDARFELFNVPIFYLPVAAGAMTQRGSPLRQISIESNNRFGPSVRTDWGLFETLGILPPEGLDVGYNLDYLGDRGPAVGLNAKYRGGFVTEMTKDPWNFYGDLDSYFIWDRGIDKLGRDRLKVTPDDEFRGQAQWEHQHFFPEDWQVQLRAAGRTIRLSSKNISRGTSTKVSRTTFPHTPSGSATPKRSRCSSSFSRITW